MFIFLKTNAILIPIIVHGIYNSFVISNSKSPTRGELIFDVLIEENLLKITTKPKRKPQKKKKKNPITVFLPF